MASNPDIRQPSKVNTVLGEGVRYDKASDSILWLDIPESRAWRLFSDGYEEELNLGQNAAFACLTQSGSILAGGEDGFSVDSVPLVQNWLGVDEVLNDGAVHPSGKFLIFGSRDRDEEKPNGRMWVLGRELVVLSWSFTVFNGPAFSPCGKFIYFADSPERIIYSAPFDPISGEVGECRIFAELPEAQGYPDGMICDDEGGLWSAHWDGGCITRYLQDGSVDRRILMPAQRITSVAFRGSTVFAASARLDTPEDLPEDQGGNLFAFDAGRSGPPAPRLKQHDLLSLSEILKR